MAKLKLIKTTLANGDIWYHITKDGKYVDGTLTNDLTKANKGFDRLKSPVSAEAVEREETI